MNLREVQDKPLWAWEKLLTSPRSTRSGPLDPTKRAVWVHNPPGWVRAGRFDLLAAAAYVRNVGLVELLVAHGATARHWSRETTIVAWDFLDWCGVRPTNQAAARLLSALTAAGADVFGPLAAGDSPFELALVIGVSVAGLLRHPDLHRPVRGKTALHSACEHGTPDLVEKLCALGADVNAVDDDGGDVYAYAHDRFYHFDHNTSYDDVARATRRVARTLFRRGALVERTMDPWACRRLGLDVRAWSFSSHRDADLATRRSVRAVFLCARRFEAVPAEIVALVCCHLSCVCVLN